MVTSGSLKGRIEVVRGRPKDIRRSRMLVLGPIGRIRECSSIRLLEMVE
jgi:hypothetical protein